MLARLATKHALDDGKPDGSKWARIAIRATEAKSTLLQDIGMLDRQIGTLFVDDGKPVERTPTGPELQERFAEIEVTEVEIVSDAERAYLHGDAAAAAAAAKEAI